MICWYFHVGSLHKRRHAWFLAVDSKRVVDSMAQVGKGLLVEVLLTIHTWSVWKINAFDVLNRSRIYQVVHTNDPSRWFSCRRVECFFSPRSIAWLERLTLQEKERIDGMNFDQRLLFNLDFFRWLVWWISNWESCFNFLEESLYIGSTFMEYHWYCYIVMEMQQIATEIVYSRTRSSF